MSSGSFVSMVTLDLSFLEEASNFGLLGKAPLEGGAELQLTAVKYVPGSK
jgi:hypothetical protein